MIDLDLLWLGMLWVLLGCCIAPMIGSASDLGRESDSQEQ